MRKNTQKITKPDTENVDFGTPFGTHVPPCPAIAPSFCDLALGTCPLVTQGVICMVFWLDLGAIFGDIWDQCCDQMPIDPGSYSPCLAKASHGHTSTRIHKWGRRGREAL